MTDFLNNEASRRDFLKLTAAAGLAGSGTLAMDVAAQSAPINFFAWSAAVDLVKSHVTAFETSTKLKVNYNNAPWAQYRDAMVTKFVGKAPLDVLWVSDSWLPEWAEAGWIAPIDSFSQLTKYNSDTDDFCLQSMRHKGKQYGLTYYSDYMAFFYDDQLLKKADIKAPPTTWSELTAQCLAIKKAGLSEYPMMLSMARESWLIEFLSAMVFSNGGRFTDDNGVSVMADPKRGGWSMQSPSTRSFRRRALKPANSTGSKLLARATTRLPCSVATAFARSMTPSRRPLRDASSRP